MAELLQAVRNGDPHAQAEVDRLVRRFARQLCRRGGIPGVPEIDWEDVAQEASHRLYAIGLDQYRGRGTERSYLYSIVKASVIQMARSASRRQRREKIAAPPETVAPGNPERRLDVRRILAALDAACRELIERAILRDEGYASLAGSLGMAESSVRAKLSRCLRKAREIAAEGERP